MSVYKQSAFALFVKNSALGKYTFPAFFARMEADAAVPHSTPQLYYSSKDIKLSTPSDGLHDIFLERKSVRSWSNRKLTEKELGLIFSPFKSRIGEEGRLIASAGGKYPIEVFAVVNNVEGACDKKIVYHNTDNHSLSIVGDAPKWSELKNILGMGDRDDVPAAYVLFVGFPDRVMGKYGERGGRFTLYDVGQFVAMLAIRIAKSGLGGYALGGVYDDEVKKLLGLQNTQAEVLLGYACGPKVKKSFFRV